MTRASLERAAEVMRARRRGDVATQHDFSTLFCRPLEACQERISHRLKPMVRQTKVYATSAFPWY
jgi:hypothetical protein